MTSIRLHRKHGLNPSLVTCFFCGKDRGEIALLGAACKGEAPRNIVLDYEPCTSCKEQMARGITLFEVEDHPVHDNQNPITGDYFPTGRWVVITEEAIGRFVNNPQLVETIRKARRTLVQAEAFERLTSGVGEPEGTA